MTKAQINIEPFGKYVRLQLRNVENEIAQNLFKNLLWVCDSFVPNVENFTHMVSKTKLKSAVKVFRSHSKFTHKGKKSSHLFEFFTSKSVSQKIEGLREEYSLGYVQDFKNPWDNYRSSLAKHFDK